VSLIDSRFSPPPPWSPEASSLMPFVASTRSEGTAPAPASNVVGSFSLGGSFSVVACSILQSFSDMLPLQVSSSSQSCITSSQSFSGVAGLGKRLCSSSPALSNSKPFQKYYQKAREVREMHMDKNFFADSMEALRPVAQVPGFLSLLPPISDPAEKVAVVLPVQDSAGVAVFVKDMGKSPSPVRGFSIRAPVVQVNLSHKVSVVSASIPVVKEGASTPSSPTAIKGEDLRVNGLTKSQKWPVGFGPSEEVVAWELGDEVWDGEDGDSPYPLGVLPFAWEQGNEVWDGEDGDSPYPLDLELDNDEDMDPSLAILEAIEEDFHRGGKAAHPKTKGRREVLNLVNSINYNDSSASSRLRKGKAHIV